jgi:DNA-directed RNA polymerase specialized sigma24 family protein
MFQDGFTAREIGDALGKSRMAVNSRLWRGRPKPIPIEEEEDELTRIWSLATFKTAS